MTKDINKEIADQYQGLFNLMSKEHGITLTISEMDEIITEAKNVVDTIYLESIAPKCDLCGRQYTKPELDAGHCFSCGKQDL